MNKLIVSQSYIGGKWVEGKDTFAVYNPATQEEIAQVSNLGQAEVRSAIELADASRKDWARHNAYERAEIMMRWFANIKKHTAELAEINTLESGKPITDATGEVSYANSFLQWFAEEGKRAYGETIPDNASGRQLIAIKQPVGVCGIITPWNFPLAMIARKVAPALAAGCVVVVRPASQTPLSALALAKLADESGIPAGVLNVVAGKSSAEMGQELCENSLVRKISFTGSTSVGKMLAAQAAGTVKRLSLELGGSAPFIVFDDGDVAEAIKGAMISKHRNTGQTCVSADRFFVHSKVYDQFVEGLIAAKKELKVGNGLEDGVQQGPLIDMRAVERLEAQITDAQSRGGQVVLGGKRHALGASFFEPTVVVGVKPDMQISCDESFGPVSPIIRFDEEDEAITMANNTTYGLASYFYSRDIGRCWRVAEGLEFGMVGVNTGRTSAHQIPFGGVKESGYGREGARQGIDEYLNLKYICMAGLDR